MFIEQQVTSLEISKRLKELGVKQESLFYWGLDGRQLESGEPKSYVEASHFFVEDGDFFEAHDAERFFSAFTVAELGLLLPWDQISSNGWDGDGEWVIDASGVPIKKVISADTEANARGKMLIYLLENKFIKQL